MIGVGGRPFTWQHGRWFGVSLMCSIWKQNQTIVQQRKVRFRQLKLRIVNNLVLFLPLITLDGITSIR